MDSVPEPIRKPEIKYTKLFINNEWVDSVDSSTFDTINPATGEVLCSVAEAKEADINRAVAAAKEAFRRGSVWRRMDASKRGLLLHRVAELMERDLVYLASLETCDSGRLYKDNLGDIPFAIRVFRYYAGWTDKNHGKTIPFDGNFFCYTKLEPIGICGAITPVAPCLATGNVLVLKPAEQTPLTALHIASYFKEVGFPQGVLNVMPGFGKTAGHALTHHQDVEKITFTGSVLTGRLIHKSSGESNMKRIALELGGKSPVIIFPDVDIDSAVSTAQQAMFNNSGQICAAASKTYVHEDIYDEFVEKTIKLCKTRKVGDPFDATVEICTLINERQEKRVLDLLETCKQEGGRIRCGGHKIKNLKGFYVAPSVVTDLTEEMTISKEEVFGPVQQIYKFKGVEEIIEKVNKPREGLAAGILCNDINTVLAITNAIEVGTVWVNTYFPAICAAAPFGGFRESGVERDFGEDALYQYTEVKTVITRLPDTFK